MTNALLRKFCMLVGLALLSGTTACSSIVEGRSQEIAINTTPAGASCALLWLEDVEVPRTDGSESDSKVAERQIASVAETPGTVLIRKTKYDIRIECAKSGFHKSVYHNKSDASAATLGNIIIGGGIGWAIDSATGADNKYTTPVTIPMISVSEPAPAPIYSINEPDRFGKKEN